MKRSVFSVSVLLSFLLLVFFIARVEAQRPGRTKVERKNKAMVVVDPLNKKNINGYTSIAFAWGERLSPPRKYLRALINLKEAMNKYTKIATNLEEHLRLGSSKLFQMPFLYITTDKAFDLSSTERNNIKEYLLNGGFIVLDNAVPQQERSQAGASLKQVIVDAKNAIGSQARLKPIPKRHPIYTCYFDFEDGPPLGAELESFVVNPNSKKQTGIMSKERRYLEGLFINDRLAAVYSDKGYVIKWNQMSNNEPQLKIGVNMLVFALIQEGGIALRQ